MPDLQQLLDQIERLDQEATKGPWESVGPSIESTDYTQDDVVSTDVNCSAYCYGGTGKGVQFSQDAEFIALARTALPQLTDAIQRVLAITERADRKGIYHPLLDDIQDAITTAMEDNDDATL